MNLTSNHLPMEKVVVGHSALISMSTLADNERTNVLQTLTQLATQAPEQWPTAKVHLRHRRESLYMLDASDQLRVFFRRDKDGTLTILNLAMQESLDPYSSSAAQQGTLS